MWGHPGGCSRCVGIRSGYPRPIPTWHYMVPCPAGVFWMYSSHGCFCLKLSVCVSACACALAGMCGCRGYMATAVFVYVYVYLCVCVCVCVCLIWRSDQVRLFEFIETSSKFFMVMTHCPGGDFFGNRTHARTKASPLPPRPHARARVRAYACILRCDGCIHMGRRRKRIKRRRHARIWHSEQQQQLLLRRLRHRRQKEQQEQQC